MTDSSLLKSLNVDSILTLVPGLSRLVFEKGSIQQYKKDQIIAKKNQRLHGLYIPIDHDLVLSTGQEKFFLLKGRSLALHSLLSNSAINYDVSAEQDVKVLFLPYILFIEHLNEYPGIKRYLELFTSSYTVRHFKRYLEQFNVPKEQLLELIADINVLSFHNLKDLNSKLEGKVLFIMKGSVTLDFINNNSSIKFLSEGAWFGTEAITPPQELSYRILNLDMNSILYYLPLKRLQDLKLKPDELLIIEQEPCIQLNEHENDLYLVDQDRGSILGQEVSFQDLLSDFPKIDINNTEFNTCNTVFESYSTALNIFTKRFNREINISSANSNLKRYFPQISLISILEILRDHDFVGYGTKPNSQAPYLKLPCLVVYQSRLLVLLFEKRQTLYGFDPIHGHFAVSQQEFFGLSDQLELIFANALYRGSEKDKVIEKYNDNTHQSKAWIEAKKILVSKKSLWLKMIIVSVLIFLINIAPPFISQEIIDEVIAIKDLQSLYSYGGLLLICYLSIFLLTSYRGRLATHFTYFFDYDFSSFFYSKLLKLKSNFFGTNRVGEVFARLGELANIRDFFSGATIQTFISLVTAIIYSFILLFYSWKIAIIPFAAITVIAILQFFLKKYLRIKYLELFMVDKKTQSTLSEMINSISTIKAFMSERAMLDKYENHFLEGVKLRRDLTLISSIMGTIISFFSHAVRVIAVWVGALLIFKSELTMGELFSINMFITRVLSPLNSLVEFFTNLEEVKVSLKKLDDIFDATPNEPIEAQSMSSQLKGRIHVNRVSFKYNESDDEVLKDINCTIYSKQVVAIVGESGCGKTTLAKLIAGSLSPTKGHILYDGVDQKFINETALKSQIGFIQQNNDLFAGSIEANATYAHSHVNKVRLDHALTVAHCHEFINRFPTGLNQYLAEGGMGLSGGQKQRLSIARTLYNDPKILILDEATSALDGESETVLIDNMKKLAIGKTTILIAHRLSTIRHADIVFVMDNGSITEKGTHEDLVRKRGKYYDLFKEQMR